MNKIHQIPQSLVSKIAAGEVIERPAYAVKELIDNALDAGATVIQVHIEEAGLKRVVVQDNGEGMTEEDLKLSFLPHTTSKLHDEHELVGVRTLGFRGEALSSIAAVATLSIKTRRHKDPGGTKLIVRNGEIEHLGPVGTPPGTIVTVDNLFVSIPARKKFLKSDKTEFRLISDVVTQFALSYPNIHFSLTHNKKTIFDLPARKDNFDRVAFLLGSAITEQLLPIDYEEGFIKIRGFIGKPHIASRQNRQQFLFVNSRPISDRIISLSVKEAFGTLLPSSSTPIFILSLVLPPETVDVNVHPRKENVSFINSKQIFDAVKTAVTTVLNEHNLTLGLAKFRQENSARIGETTSFAGELLRESVLPWDRSDSISINPSTKLIQIHQTYILSQAKNGLVFVDQHAAHERILYEEFIKSFETKKLQKQSVELEKPLTLEVALNELQIIDENKKYFGELGFMIEEFPGNTIIIRKVPLVFKGRNIEKVIRELVTDLENETIKFVDERSRRMLAFLSCRAAVKAGDVLTDKEMKDILRKLEQTDNNDTCPQGRPTSIQVTLEELHRSFKR